MFGFPAESYTWIPLLSQSATCPAHLILLDAFMLIILGEKNKFRSSILIFSAPNILFSNLFQYWEAWDNIYSFSANVIPRLYEMNSWNDVYSYLKRNSN
jgi:hypothetical protein